MSEPGRTRRGISVLLVDDQPMIGEAVARMLEAEPGIRFHHCIDPADALASAARVQATVILLDLVMPEIDGLTLIRYFRANPPTRDVPIIVLSTREDPAVKAEAFALGASDYLVKLPDRVELVARIRHHSRGYLGLVDAQDAWEALVESRRQLEVRNRFIRQTFGRYLSDQIVESLLELPGGLNLGGELRRVTIMMTDLRGFTPMCETLAPPQVVAILNTYLGVMTEIVVEHGGTIDDFIGDAILAIFGAPVRHDDDAERAVACAVAMQLAMERVNQRNRDAGLPALEMGIGLDTGEVVIGNIGSDRRAKYSVVGNHVNLASRIESYTVGGQILATEATVRDAGDQIRIDGELEVELKGMAAPVTLYDVGGIGGRHQRFLGRDLEPVLELATPIPVRFVLLDGKRLRGDWAAGEIVALSSRRARIRSARVVAPLHDLKLELGAGGGAALWAKTLPGPAAEVDGFEAWFTAVPDELRRELATHLDASRRL